MHPSPLLHHLNILTLVSNLLNYLTSPIHPSNLSTIFKLTSKPFLYTSDNYSAKILFFAALNCDLVKGAALTATFNSSLRNPKSYSQILF